MSVASSIALSGMTVATLRLQVSASNLANSLAEGPLPGSTSAAFSGAYSPLRVDQVETVGGGTSAIISTISPSYVPKFDPTAPYADGNGMVASPNVDLASDVIRQMLARYSFAANAQVLRADVQATATLLNTSC